MIWTRYRLARDWHRLFAGQWIFLHTRTGIALEGQCEAVTSREVRLSSKLEVYGAVQGVRMAEAVIEESAVRIPLAEVDLMRTGNRQRAQDFCVRINAHAQGLTQGIVVGSANRDQRRHPEKG